VLVVGVAAGLLVHFTYFIVRSIYGGARASFLGLQGMTIRALSPNIGYNAFLVIWIAVLSILAVVGCLYSLCALAASVLNVLTLSGRLKKLGERTPLLFSTKGMTSLNAIADEYEETGIRIVSGSPDSPSSSPPDIPSNSDSLSPRMQRRDRRRSAPRSSGSLTRRSLDGTDVRPRIQSENVERDPSRSQPGKIERRAQSASIDLDSSGLRTPRGHRLSIGTQNKYRGLAQDDEEDDISLLMFSPDSFGDSPLGSLGVTSPPRNQYVVGTPMGTSAEARSFMQHRRIASQVV